nr:protein NLP7-like isoform X2 [Coffea arabica]
MEARTSPSLPFSTEGLGSCELSCFRLIKEEDYNEYNWVFWSTCGNDEGGCGKPHHLSATADGAVIKDQIKWFLQLVMEAISWCRCLVQFWGLVKTGDKTYLTTCDQPFALQYFHFNGPDVKELCEYRKHCLEYLIPVDEDHEIGPPGRVFRSGSPEYAPRVDDYTSREYPQRDYAVGRVAGSWVLPIYHHPTQHLPIGVLEIVSATDFSIPRCLVLDKLQKVNLRTTCVRLAEASSCQRGEIATIDEALGKMRKICGVAYGCAKTWTTSGEILSSHGDVDFIRKGQGVVGRAFSSKSACFCRDIRQLSITDYPLLLKARYLKRSACFAVCLQSFCSNNCIYVLEFFLPMYEKDEDEDEADYGDPRTLLNSLMETLNECLGSSFKIASGQELGQKLTVEVIKVSPEDEFDSFEIYSTTGIGGEGMTKLQMALFSAEGLGPCELSMSHSLDDIDEHYWVFWSTCGNDEGGCGKPHHLSATADGAVIKDQIKCFLQLLEETLIQCDCLVQFWGLVKMGDKTYLTTCDQPFALQYRHIRDAKKLCKYRKHCLGYLLPVDEEDDDDKIGPPGRVFRSGSPEYTPCVDYYTSREYPQCDYAVGPVAAYWVLPIYHHPTRHLPIGVLEIVSPRAFTGIPRRWVLEKLQNLLWEMNLTTVGVNLAQVNSCQDGEIAKIDEALSEVTAICGLDDTETWITSGEILSSLGSVDFIHNTQGVVGRAFSSKSACFCRDVRQLSITKYPLVVQARYHNYSACFAVCLQSSCSSNCIYVLEFFLPTYEEDEDEADYGEDEADYGDPRTLLNSLMETLKEHLGSSFKIASGQELGQKLTVDVIKVSPEDKFDSFEFCNTTGIESKPRLEEVQGGDGMMQLDFSSQQVDAANGSMDGIHNQQNRSVGSTRRRQNGSVGSPEDEFDSFEICSTAGIESQPRLEEVQGGDGMMQLDFSSQQVDAANGSMDGIHNQQHGSIGSTPRNAKAQGEGMVQVDNANGHINGVHAQQSGIVGSPPRPEHVQGIVNISDQELNLAGVDVVHNSTDGVYEQKNGIDRSSTGQEVVQNMVSIAHDEPIVEDPRRNGASIEQRDNEVTNLEVQKPSWTLKSDLGITREVLEQNSTRRLEDAAKNIGVSRSTLKRICREYGINRWPPRKARKVSQALAVQKTVQPSTEDTHEHHRSDATRLEDDNGMWVKAEYQGRMIKFRLPFSARKIDLEENVVQRLNLATGSFIIEYQDEDDDRIWITCDRDLSTCMSTLSSLGRTTIKMYIVEDSPNR